MAEEMGSDREALVNQAMHVLRPPQRVPAAPRRPGGPGRPASQVAEQVLETAPLADGEPAGAAAPPERATGRGPDAATCCATTAPRWRSGKERFVIGRGRHCDLVVDGSKVSREHAVVVRDDAGWLVEDLHSANGTWHRGARLEKLRLEDGDEYFVCAERIRCLLR